MPRFSRSPWALALALALPSSALGCVMPGSAALPLVRTHAAYDLDCPEDDLLIEQDLGGWFEVKGCGRKARYSAACQGVACVVQPESQGPLPWGDRPEPVRANP